MLIILYKTTNWKALTFLPVSSRESYDAALSPLSSVAAQFSHCYGAFFHGVLGEASVLMP